MYLNSVPSTMLDPLRRFRISTISQFVFNGNSCPVKLIKYLNKKNTFNKFGTSTEMSCRLENLKKPPVWTFKQVPHANQFRFKHGNVSPDDSDAL